MRILILLRSCLSNECLDGVEIIKESTKTRVDVALNRGELWRAKEILQGNLVSTQYDVELFEKLGSVLLQMGDLAEAGKYLFLSGVRKSQYEESIEIYLRRYTSRRSEPLYFTFPRAARLQRLSDYPAVVADELRKLGFEEQLPGRKKRKSDSEDAANGKWILYGCFVIALAILVAAFIGVVQVAAWIWGY